MILRPGGGMADTLDLGSSAQAWGFKSLAGHQLSSYANQNSQFL